MKIWISYFMKFIQSISLFIITLTSIMLITIYNKNYVLDLLENNNYYQELYDVSKEEVSYYLIQSGLPEDITDDIFDVKELKTTVDKTINSLYSNTKIILDTENIKTKLTDKINQYIEDNKINVKNKDKTIKELVEKLVNVYEEEISYNNLLENVRDIFNKSYKIVKISLILAIVSFIVTYLINRLLFRERNIIVSLFTNGLLLIGTVLYTKFSIDIDNISFYNTSISNILKEFINSVLANINLVGVISIVLGVLLAVTVSGVLSNLKKNKRLYNSILVVIWMIVIFCFSAQTGVKSTKTSNVVTSMVVNVTTNVSKQEITREEAKKRVEDSTFLIRKLAHFTEYLILGILIIRLLRTYGKLNVRMIITAIIICFLYAASDEIHQIFVPGRTAKVLDTLIDTSGASIGIIFYCIFKNKWRNLSNDN